MRNLRILPVLALATAAVFHAPPAAAEDPALSQAAFESPPHASKVHAWWHWISGGVTREGMTKDLESMKAQGISQVTILNIGGHAGRDVGVPMLTFGSPQWYGAFRFALEEGKRLGITVGAHNCDGWSTSGGPWVPPEMSMKTFVWSRENVSGGAEVSLALHTPPTKQNYYEDVTVLAFPNRRPASPYVQAAPEVASEGEDLSKILSDGNFRTETAFAQSTVIAATFEQPYEAEELTLLPFLEFAWSSLTEATITVKISALGDNGDLREIHEAQVTGGNVLHRVPFPRTRSTAFRVECVANGARLNLAELELLPAGAQPTFSQAIPHLIQKSVNVKVEDHDMYAPGEADQVQPLGLDEVLDVSDHMDAEGNFTWDAPEGEWSVVRFGFTSTGRKNKPATEAGTGLEIDKMNPEAARLHFDAFAGKLIDVADELVGSTFKFLLVDSWECGYQNWTQAFPQEFDARQGYDLHRWIPVLCGEVVESPEQSEAFLHDFRATINELIGEGYYQTLGELCRDNGLELHAEVIYGGGRYPSLDVLEANRHADMPMVEFWARTPEPYFTDYTPRDQHPEYLAAYTDLAFGKKLIGAEAYTNNYYFSESPAELKPFGDSAFCSGINQLIFHSYVHQPFDRPMGVTLSGWGAPFNRNNPWWNHTSEWLRFQNRVQYVLQKGEPVVDAILYMGDQEPHQRTNPIARQMPFGHRLNACNLGMLRDRARVIDGQLSFGGEQRFAFLALPEENSMEFATLQRIAALVEEGMALYGPKPSRMLGRLELNQHRADFAALADKLWGEGAAESVDRTVGRGRVLWGMSVGEVFKQLHVTPDLASTNTTAKELMFIHKRNAGEDFYYVFNQTDRPLHTELLFRVNDRQPERWQAETGETAEQPVYTVEGDQTRLPVSFKPYESFFFVFREARSKPHVAQLASEGAVLFPAASKPHSALPRASYGNGGIRFEPATGGSYQLTLDDGQTREVQLPEPLEIVLEDRAFEVRFEPLYDQTLEPIVMSPLRSLHESEDPQVRYFAGAVHYRLAFDLSEEQLAQLASGTLNLGAFDAVATATLNGTEIAKLWNHGTQTPVGPLLKASNVLEVTVTTVGRNRVIGDVRTFGELRNLYTTAPIRPRFKPDLPLKPTGLLGPVRLTGRAQVLSPLR